MCVCVGFLSVAAELCLLPLLLLGVGWALVVPLLVWLLCLSWGTCGFPLRVLQLVTLLGFRTYLTPVSWPTPAVDVYCWFSTLCQHSFPFRCLPLAGSATFLATVCWSTPAVETCCWFGGVFDASLGFLPGAVLFLRDLRLAQLTLQRVPLGIFRSLGVCPSASLVT